MQIHEHNTMEGEVGFITEAKGYLITLEGLPSVRINTIIVNSKGHRAIVTALKQESVQALLLDRVNPKAGDRFIISPDGVQFSFGDHLFGRAINVLGEQADGLGEFLKPNSPLRMEGEAPTISARAPMLDQLITGMPSVDILLPIAKGQRQLVVGPISSGKTVFLEEVFAHQKNTDVVCIYAFIGRPRAYIEEAVARLFSERGNKKTIVIVAFSDDTAPEVYIAPIVALELAEFFSWEGKDVLVVLDDLGSHAKYLREIALLSGEVPGRESYPGDMFYQQARLLERGGRFNRTLGDGSITILPVLETNIEDLSNLVSTNLVSATDGHFFFSPLLHSEGYFPALVPEQSVTRVGRKAQTNLAKQLSIRALALIGEYERQRRFSQFGMQLSEKTRFILTQGESMQTFLNQDSSRIIPIELQIFLLSLIFTSLLKGKKTGFARLNRDILLDEIPKHKELEPILASARRGTVSLDSFLNKLEENMLYIQNLCKVQ